MLVKIQGKIIGVDVDILGRIAEMEISDFYVATRTQLFKAFGQFCA